ncbi:peptidoglycan DD-metalloendopeptidase family protein [Georgenia sp. MJ206]|uniref:peptidoglycan DD-metalloendopeptidase family protein n=1 Tax=Georgenia wangjunii TaxID=3117730 RepID=UPI002F25F485
MPERAHVPSTAPLTRRQIREAERLAAQRTAGRAVPRPVAPEPLASTPAGPASTPAGPASTPAGPADEDAAPASSAAAPVAAAPARAIGSSAPAALPSRAERRRAEQLAAQQVRPRRTFVAPPRWLPRAAVLGALGAATIIAPLTAFASPDHGLLATQRPVAVAPQESALDLLDSAAARTAVEASGSASALMADLGAPGRALVEISRSVERDVAVCVPAKHDGANGARAALAPEGLVVPIRAGAYNLSSDYGDRVHPITGVWSKHEGLDYAAAVGTPIHAVADGTVVHAGNGIDGRSSMLVIIEHEVDGQTFYSWYVHMYADGVFVEVGQPVEAGDVIGEVGNNGNSTGPHLHLEIHLDLEGTTTDPEAFLAAHGAVLLEPAACTAG